MTKYIALLMLVACAHNHSQHPKVSGVLSKNISKFEYCVHTYQDKKQSTVEKIDITFVIGKKGQIKNARIENFDGDTAEDYLESSRQFSTIINLKTERCVIEALKKLRFPTPKELGSSKSSVKILQTLQFDLSKGN